MEPVIESTAGTCHDCGEPLDESNYTVIEGHTYCLECGDSIDDDDDDEHELYDEGECDDGDDDDSEYYEEDDDDDQDFDDNRGDDWETP
jgi:hypothetical protein